MTIYLLFLVYMYDSIRHLQWWNHHFDQPKPIIDVLPIASRLAHTPRKAATTHNDPTGHATCHTPISLRVLTTHQAPHPLSVSNHDKEIMPIW